MNVRLNVVVSFSGKLRIAAIPTLEFVDALTDVFPAETAMLTVAFERADVVKNSADARNCKNIWGTILAPSGPAPSVDTTVCPPEVKICHPPRQLGLNSAEPVTLQTKGV